MNTITKTLSIAALAMILPVMAISASAADMPQSKAPLTSLTGSNSNDNTRLIASTTAEKTIQVAGRRHGVGLAAGIIAGAAAVAILSGSARAHHRDVHAPYGNHRARYYNRCDRWYDRCEYGNRRACRKYYRHCD